MLVAGERRTLDAAAHLAAVFVPPEGGQGQIKARINDDRRETLISIKAQLSWSASIRLPSSLRISEDNLVDGAAASLALGNCSINLHV